MRCEDWRAVLSAAMDGEAGDDEAAAARSHVAACPGCAAWSAAADAASRRARVAPAVAVADRTPELLAAARAASRRDVASVLRVALAAIAAAQLALAGPDLLSGGSAGHSARHLGSWGVALGVGFLVAALRPARAAGLLPFVAALVGSVAVTMVVDPGSDAREVQHLVEVVGLVLLWALSGGRAAARVGVRA